VLHSPILAMRRVVIVGATEETSAAVLDTAGLVGHPPLIDIDPGLAATRLARLPYVARATVERVWPTEVRIVITERQPVAFTTLVGGHVALFDRTGRVLADDAAPPSGLLPVTGIGAVPQPGAQLSPPATAVLEAVGALPASLVARVGAFSETPADGIELQISGGPLVVLGTSAQLREKYVALVTLARSAAASLAAAKTVDLRVPDAPVLTG
jgi:cell division protein FtsQ